MKNKSQKFLKIPEYSGGKKAFREYIKENLIYPKEALNNKVQGIVYLVAEVDDNGRVFHVVVEKGIGAGCDEEAIRLIENIHYYAVRNKGVRVKTKKRFRIEFKLPPQPLQSENKINYNLTRTNSETKNTPPSSNVYSYSIKIKNS